MPFYLPDHDEFVAHVHGVVVGLDLEHARRPQAGAEVGMSRFVNYLATFIGKAGVAYEFRREREPHREGAIGGGCGIAYGAQVTYLECLQLVSAEQPPSASAGHRIRRSDKRGSSALD